MSGPPVHKPLPRWVNPKKFAYQGTELSGTVALKDLLRLKDVMAVEDPNQAAPIHAEVSFFVDEEGLRRVKGYLTSDALLTCQRCMQPAQVAVDSEMNLAVVSTEAAVKALPKHVDPWLVEDLEGQADLYQAIEEELLLSLPMVAYHSEQCIDPALYSSGDEVEVKAENPFRVLEKLRDAKSKQ